MSSKPMFRVQEEVASLKQLLALVSNGLHRNAVTIAKLKQESAMVGRIVPDPEFLFQYQ